MILDKAPISELDEVDDEHRRLIALFNMLGHAIRTGSNRAYTTALFDKLISYTISDFSLEEGLMIRTDYKEFEEHRAEHRRLLERARSLQQNFRDHEGAISEQDIEYLEHWLTGHILDADWKLCQYLSHVL